MSLPSLSVRNPVLVNLIVLLIVVGGVFAYRSMPQDLYPDASMAAVSVTTIMPGSSPKEIEQLLTIPIEEELSKIDDIDTMSSGSAEGISNIFVQFNVDTDQIFEKMTEVQNRVQQVERFPDEAEVPIVREVRPPFSTATVAILGTAPEHELREFAEDLEHELKSLNGVAEVRVAGLREREIWVEVDPHRLSSYGLSLRDVAAALQRRNLNLPGGSIRMERGAFTVRTEAEYQNLDQIRDTILVEDQSGYVYVRDIGRVTDTFEDRRSLARLDGRPSVNLVVTKDKYSHTLALVDRIQEIVADFQRRAPAGISMKLVDDASIEIRSRLQGLYSNLLLGLFLVVGSIAIFIGRRAGLMVAAGIPVAFLATFVMLDLAGHTVNSLVLFALILVLGIVVDDAIVICENVYRHYENGMPLHQAAVVGAEQLTWPVVATVLTTVAAFLPLLLMEGILGEFMSVIPIVVALALGASLFEALFILPAHIAEWGGTGTRRTIEHSRPWLHRTLEIYGRVLGQFLRFRYLAVAGVVVLGILSLALARSKMEFILFGGRDLEGFSVAVEAPPGATIEETTRIIDQIQTEALDLADRTGEVESVRSEVGSLRRSGFDRASGVHVGEVTLDLVDLTERDRLGAEVMDELREAIRDITGVRAANIEESRQGPPVGKAVAVQVLGDNFDTLRVIADEVKEFLVKIDGVKDVIDSFPRGKDEVRPVLDLERIAALGLDVRAVATEIRGAFDGLEATRVYDAKEEVEVMVKYDAANRRSLADLADMQFATPNGMVPFSNVARLERVEGVSQIGHHDQRRSINVTADVVPGIITSSRVNQMLLEQFADVPDRFPGYDLSFGGEWEDTQESVSSMFRAFVVSIILIYVILGGLFRSFIQPLIVMVTVPFAFIGVILGFFILGEPLGLFSVIGTIALAGIVVNDSLILIDFINRKRREGLDEVESILVASAMRVRPILLTSLTTILGLFPMCIGLFGVDRFLKPMATAIAFGLTFSTVLCLLVVPCVYRVFDDLSKIVFKRPLSMTAALGDPLPLEPGVAGS